jgi:hypothetical protein
MRVDLELTEPMVIETSLGPIPVWHLPGMLASRKPVILTLTGAWASPDVMGKMQRVVGEDWDAGLMRLPGNGAPPLTETSIAAWSRALGELVESAFAGRIVVLLGLSVGALVMLGVRSPLVRRVIALEPPLVMDKLWPMIGDLRVKWRDEPHERPVVEAVFGVTGDSSLDRRYFGLFDGARPPVDIVVGDIPLLPERALARFPSFVDMPERAWIAAQPGVSLHVAPGAGHAVQVFAAEFTRDVILDALGKALSPRTVHPWQYDQALVDSTPLSARRILYVGPRGEAYAAAVHARNPQAEVVCRAEAGGEAGFDAVAVEGGGRTRPAAGAEAVEPLRLEMVAFAPRLMDIRARLPAQALGAEPDLAVAYATPPFRLPPASREQPKILVLQRPGSTDDELWRQSLAESIAKGWLVVLEFDDHPDLVAEVTGRPVVWERFGHQHAIQTSTARLATLFARWNPEVAVFRNAVFELLPFPELERAASVFYGGVTRGAFAADAARALAPAIEAFPNTPFEVVGDRAVFDALPTSMKRFHDYLAYEDYLELMSTCSVSLSPLAPRRHIETKSDAKFLDAARAGVLTLASPPVYEEIITHGETGLIARELADWAPLLTRALADRGDRQRMARNAWDYVRGERMFAHQIADRKAWYRSLWDRREALTRGLMDRLPGLEEATRKASGG